MALSTPIQPAIIVVTYNRLTSLQRILASLAKANYEGYQGVDLIISIDGGGSAEVGTYADAFEWAFGQKKVIHHPQNLGLRKHILSCGDLTAEYEGIILLEDDLVLSPNFYDYSVQALNFYGDDKSIAGISLYSYRLNENVYLPFLPLPDGNDTFFMQVPSSWGQVWTRSQWDAFKQYYETDPQFTAQDKLPANVKSWPASSWKKYFYKYLVDSSLYFVYPYHSYSTNSGDAGHHLNFNLNYLQVPLMNGLGHTTYKFARFEDSHIKYDAYLEMEPDCLKKYGLPIADDCVIDLYGSKQLDLFNEELVYSTKACLNPVKTFGATLHPLINNLLLNVEGDIISLGRKQDFLNQPIDKTRILSVTDSYVFTYTEQYVMRKLPYKIGKYLLNPTSIFKKFTRK